MMPFSPGQHQGAQLPYLDSRCLLAAQNSWSDLQAEKKMFEESKMRVLEDISDKFILTQIDRVRECRGDSFGEGRCQAARWHAGFQTC
jgi:hypothetical protein